MILVFLIGGMVFLALDELAGRTAVAGLAALCVFVIVAQAQRRQHLRVRDRETSRERWAGMRHG